MKKSYITPMCAAIAVSSTEIIAASVGFGSESGPTIENGTEILIREENPWQDGEPTEW